MVDRIQHGHMWGIWITWKKGAWAVWHQEWAKGTLSEGTDAFVFTSEADDLVGRAEEVLSNRWVKSAVIKKVEMPHG